MKHIAKLTLGAVALILLSANLVHAVDNSIGIAAASTSTDTDELARLVENSRWYWYFGELKGNIKSVTRWVELYKDGTARMPWSQKLQTWTIQPPNTLRITGAARGDYVFTMDVAKKAGDDDKGLHIRFERRASGRF